MESIVTEDNRRLFYRHQKKEGSPTLIFESGLGGDSEIWSDLIELIRNDFSFLAYDRAGLGKSDYPDFEQTALTVFEDLKKVIDTLKLDPPFLFVGHSYGGALIKSHVENMECENIGLVFVDSSDENFQESMFSYRNDEQSEHLRKVIETPPPAELKGANREFRAFRDVLKSVSETQKYRNFPAISLVCGDLMKISSSNDSSDTDQRLAPLDVLQKDNLGWVELHKNWIAHCPKLEVSVIDDCSHFIHRDQPSKVADAIRKVAAMTTGNKAL